MTPTEIEALGDERGWRPIESAPKDGRRFIAAFKDADMGSWIVVADVGWHRDHWCSDGDGYIEPTHWMPLPIPPTA